MKNLNHPLTIRCSERFKLTPQEILKAIQEEEPIKETLAAGQSRGLLCNPQNSHKLVLWTGDQQVFNPLEIEEAKRA